MPDKRLHRGPHPEDAVLFGEANWPRLRQASGDLCWLLSRGYAQPSAIKLVGDRYQLAQRQRVAMMRATCSDLQRDERIGHQVAIDELARRPLLLDGYNVLTTVEAALAGGVILHARDECFRDLASVHGTFRQVEETRPALHLLGHLLEQLQISEIRWYFDRPVSNSGRLRATMLELASSRSWNWSIELVNNPDTVLAQSPEIVATADSAILDHRVRWVNLARVCVEQFVSDANVVDLRPRDP